MRSRSLSSIILVFGVALVLLGIGSEPAHGAETAVVRGISKLYVRRGPGREFPPFASLSEGSVVEVQGTEGQWARVMTANGQVGYVARRYIASEGDAPAATVAVPTPTRRPPNTPTARRPARTPTARRPVPTPTSRPVKTATEPRRSPSPIAPTATPEATGTTVETATIEPTPEPALAPTEIPARDEPAAAPRAEDEAIRGELHHLRIAVERLQRRLDEVGGVPGSGLPLFEDADPDSSSISGGAVLVSLLALALGWFLGSSYTRKQERGRRSRIRF